MSRVKMERARDLIRAQRYAEARAILEPINHPAARQWLAKLDALELGDPFERRPRPTHRFFGNLLGALSLIAGVVVIVGVPVLVSMMNQDADYSLQQMCGVIVLVALGVAYVGNRMGKRLRGRSL